MKTKLDEDDTLCLDEDNTRSLDEDSIRCRGEVNTRSLDEDSRYGHVVRSDV